MTMTTRAIGGRAVSAIGLGAAGLSVADFPPEENAIETIVAALEAGVTLIDSAACYVPDEHSQGHNETLIAKALARWSGDFSTAAVATKGGIKRTGSVDFTTDFVTSGRPEFIKEQADAALKALGVDAIWLFQLHTPGLDVPLAETMGAFKELQDDGKVVNVGVCNVTVAEAAEVASVVTLASVQNRFNPADRRFTDVVDWCAANEVAFLAYSPLDGLGKGARELGTKLPTFVEVANERGVSVQQVALAWELAQSPTMIPIPGARRPATIRDSAAAAGLVLTDAELVRLNG